MGRGAVGDGMSTAAAIGPAAAPDQAEPVSTQGSARIASLDFIRGIAVLGILAANITAFGQPMTAYMYPGAFLTPHGAAEPGRRSGRAAPSAYTPELSA